MNERLVVVHVVVAFSLGFACGGKTVVESSTSSGGGMITTNSVFASSVATSGGGMGGCGEGAAGCASDPCPGTIACRTEDDCPIDGVCLVGCCH